MCVCVCVCGPQGETSTLVGDAAKDMELIWLKAEKLVERYASGIIAGESHTSKEVSVLCLCLLLLAVGLRRVPVVASTS